ncbi:MAG: sulfatase-like hydrolase/transferase, partial [Verrucomicrobiota bacterium]
SEGTRYTQAYVPMPSCSPSRGGMMTGRFPHRLGLYNYIQRDTSAHLMDDEITFAKILQENGYETCFVGKWGLNSRDDFKNQPTPADHGFDYWLATQNNALPTHENPVNYVRNGEALGEVEGYSVQIIVDEAIEWLANREDKAKPFCLVVWPHEPHLKLGHPEEYERLYDGEGLAERTVEYNANVSHLDAQLGRLLATVDEMGYKDDTFAFFTSDNGAHEAHKNIVGSSGIYRGGKGVLYEGGIRMPTIIRWPAVLEPGTMDNTIVSTMDLLPTICEIASVPVPSEREIDGVSLYGHLRGERLEREEPLFFADVSVRVALRDGDWKLLAAYQPSKGYSDMLTYLRNRKILGLETTGRWAPQLYNLKDDPSETNNVVAQYSDIAQSMLEKAGEMSREIQHDMPDQPQEHFIPKKHFLRLSEGNPDMPLPATYNNFKY